jgi:MFS family permease
LPSIGGSIGLLAGGILTQSINWHWIFFVNIPIGIITAVLANRLLDSRDVLLVERLLGDAAAACGK